MIQDFHNIIASNSVSVYEFISICFISCTIDITSHIYSAINKTNANKTNSTLSLKYKAKYKNTNPQIVKSAFVHAPASVIHKGTVRNSTRKAL